MVSRFILRVFVVIRSLCQALTVLSTNHKDIGILYFIFGAFVGYFCVAPILLVRCWIFVVFFALFEVFVFFSILVYCVGHVILKFDYAKVNIVRAFIYRCFFGFIYFSYGIDMFLLSMLFVSLFFNTPVRYVYYKILEISFAFLFYLVTSVLGRYNFIRVDLWLHNVCIFFKYVVANGYSFKNIKKIPTLPRFSSFLFLVYSWGCFVQSILFCVWSYFGGIVVALALFFFNFLLRQLLFFIKPRLFVLARRLLAFTIGLVPFFTSKFSLALPPSDTPVDQVYQPGTGGGTTPDPGTTAPLLPNFQGSLLLNNVVQPVPLHRVGLNHGFVPNFQGGLFHNNVVPNRGLVPIHDIAWYIRRAKAGLYSPVYATFGYNHVAAIENRHLAIGGNQVYYFNRAHYRAAQNTRLYSLCLKGLAIGGTLLSGALILSSIFGGNGGGSDKGSESFLEITLS